MKLPRFGALHLILVGAALVLLGASVTVMVPGAGFPPGSGVPLRLAEGEAAEWTFATDQERLTAVRVWLAQPAPAGAELVLRLGEAAIPEIALAETAQPLVTGLDGAVELHFSPLRLGPSPFVVTTTVKVRLAARGLEPASSLALLAGDSSPGTVQPAFVPLYQVRPFDALWPISRMAEGRPGLLGWPPGYALLGYSFLVLLLHGLWKITAATASGRRRPD